MKFITIDFETYYDSKYSLSNLTMWEYIHDDRFEVIGVAIKYNKQKPRWYAGLQVDEVLSSIDFKKYWVLAHNTAFDGAILSWRYGIKPKFWFDTLSMARPFHDVEVGGSLSKLASYYKLGEKGKQVIQAKGKRLADFTEDDLSSYGNYCKNDVNLTFSLFKKLYPRYNDYELNVINRNLLMYTRPLLRLCAPTLHLFISHHERLKEKLISSLPDGCTVETLSSNAKLARALERLGVKPPTKKSIATGKQTYAFANTDSEFLALRDHTNKDIANLVKARLVFKKDSGDNKAKRMLAIAEKTGRLPVLLNYGKTQTGRFSGGDKINIQNLPKGEGLRSAILPPAGYSLAVADLSQIEPRILAVLSGETGLVEAFRERRDVYCDFASKLYNKPVRKDNKLERFIAKKAILGLGYGMGANRFCESVANDPSYTGIKISRGESQNIVDAYRANHKHIKALWGWGDEVLAAMASGDTKKVGHIHKCITVRGTDIILPNMLPMRYPGIKHSNRGDGFTYLAKGKLVNIYGAKLIENIVQALARIVITSCMLRVGNRYPVVSHVHDEIVAVAPRDGIKEATLFIEEKMTDPVKWMPELPLACEIGCYINYGGEK